MKIFCNNTKNIIIAVAFACVCLVGVGTAEAECYYSNCPPGYTYTSNEVRYWSWGGLASAGCFPCGGYCWIGIGYPQGPVCAHITSYFLGSPSYPVADSCISPGSYLLYCNGECTSTHFNCNVGLARAQRNEATGWAWRCDGANGGSNANCFEYYPINGACSSPPNHAVAPCAKGTQVNLVTSTDKWTWDCKGKYGGTDAIGCTENNCAPNTCVGQTCPNPSGVVPGTKQPDWQKRCSSTPNPCGLEDCESTIPSSSTICTMHDNNGCSSDTSCNSATCPASGTQTCGACPVDFGGWKEVSP